MSTRQPSGLLPRVADPDAGTGVAALSNTLTGSFVTATAEAFLPQSRELNQSTRVTITDNGPQGTIDVAVDAATDALLTELSTAGLVTVSASTIPNARVLTAGTGISVTDGGAGGLVTIAATGAATETTVVVTFTLVPSDASIGNSPATFDLSLVFRKSGSFASVYLPPSPAFNGGTLGFSLIASAAGVVPVGYRPVTTNALGFMPVFYGGAPTASALVVLTTGQLFTNWAGFAGILYNWPAGVGAGWNAATIPYALL
jgi:hypothetical protein